MVVCPACSQENLSDRRFCTKCGQSLWRKCLQCGGECAASEKFCGSCGANDDELVAARLEDIAAAVRQARAARESGDFSAALAALKRLPNTDHPRISEPLAEARQLAAGLANEKTLREQDAAQAIRAAAESLEKRQYQETLLKLRNIPDALRTEEARHLLATAESSYREIKQLQTQIAADVGARRMTQLAPKVDRYLALQPNDERIRVLATRVRDHLVARARRAVAAADYPSASQLLESVPLSAGDDTTQQLGELIRELVRLQAELRSAVHADPRLLTIAERLSRLAPQDAKATKIIPQLTARLRQGAPDPRFPIIPWAPAPKRSQVGAPVHWLGGFQRLPNADPNNEAKLRQHAGMFFVAAGLALQGLGKARVTINLARTEDPSKLFSALRRFRKTAPVTSAWGLDVGQSALKVVKLGPSARSADEIAILACDYLPYAVNLAAPEAESQQMEMIAQALRTWRDRYQPAEDEPICINGASSKTLGRFFQIPSVQDKKLADLIACEVRHQIPYPLTDLSWGYQVLDSAPSSKTTMHDTVRAVVVAALRSGDVKDRMQPFEQLGIPVHAIQAEPLALYNFAAFDCLDQPGPSQPGPSQRGSDLVPKDSRLLGLLDLGSDAANLLVCSTERVWFRTLRWGGNDVNREMAREFKLTSAQAEEVKRDFAQARRLATLLEILDRHSAKLLAEVLRSLEAFQAEQLQQSVDQFWVCGGGANHFGLLRHFGSGPAAQRIKAD